MQYEEVARKAVYDTLHEVPRMFQIWACKQVMSIAGTNLNQSKYKDNHNPSCPSCTVCEESCEHILMCNEEGRVEALMVSIALMDKWMRNAGTGNALRQCLVEYAKERGGKTMENITRGWGQRFQGLAASMDQIGRRHFMEGMIPKEIILIQNIYTTISRVCSVNRGMVLWSCGEAPGVHTWSMAIPKCPGA